MLDLPGDTAGISGIEIQDGFGRTVLHALSNTDATGILTETIRHTKQRIDVYQLAALYWDWIKEDVHVYIENAGPIYPEDEEEYRGLCRKYMGSHAHVQLSDEEERDLFRQYNSSNNQEDKKKIRDEILRLYYPLAIAIAQKYKTEYLPTEDLVQAGIMAIIENLPTKKFHYPEHGHRCAKWALTGIIKYIEEHAGIVHIPPLQREIGEKIQGILYIRDGVKRGESSETVRENMERHVGLGEVNISLWKQRSELLRELRSTRIEMLGNMTGIAENDMVTDDTEAESLDMKKLTWELLQSLSELETKVLIERFYHDKSFEEIGNTCEISPENVQKIMGKIRATLAKKKEIFRKFEDLFGPKWGWNDYIKSL